MLIHSDSENAVKMLVKFSPVVSEISSQTNMLITTRIATKFAHKFRVG